MNRNEQQTAEKIRNRYVEKQPTRLDELRELDARVMRPAAVFAYVFGSISAVIMGCGMSLVMTDIGTTLALGDPLIPGIVIGVAGLLLALINYPMYKGILNSRRKKYAGRILSLSEQIMNDK